MKIVDINLGGSGIVGLMASLGHEARKAAGVLGLAPTAQKNEALHAAAAALRAHAPSILAANEQDMTDGKAKALSHALLDRLLIDRKRLESIAVALEEIAALPDPVGQVMDAWERPNGLKISRVRVPLGVIGIIYESRPGVTADAGALCLKSGNATILRGGSESYHSNHAVHACLVEGLRKAGLPEAAITLVPTTDREAVGEMLRGLDGSIDVIVPRGGKSLVARVQEEARVPVFAHLDGICHVYVDRDADLEVAEKIVLNAKLRRTGICGAAETLLIDKACAKTHLAPLVKALLEAGCEVRGDEETQNVDPRVKAANIADWSTEYLDAIISVKLVDGVDDAMRHIATFGSHHTESVVTDNVQTAEKFLSTVDSAVVLHNASTQFADGGQFGMGAEIGIATGKFHARGPVGLEQLTSFKYVVRGSGQIRP